jgi:hypothetical protein
VNDNVLITGASGGMGIATMVGQARRRHRDRHLAPVLGAEARARGPERVVDTSRAGALGVIQILPAAKASTAVD